MTRTTITGPLRDAILKRLDEHDEGQLVQSDEETISGSGCETCWFEYEQFTLYVNGETVYTCSDGSNALTSIMEWLEEND